MEPHADWLDENWRHMCETVLTMANNQIIELERASSRKISSASLVLTSEKDAKVALRLCKGNIWQAVERCVQRYQDNKVFGTEQLKTLLRQQHSQPTGKSRSFSLKVTGSGNGKPNNDANCTTVAGADVVEEEVENLMNPDKLYQDGDAAPVDDSYELIDENDDALLNWYIDKIKHSEDIRAVTDDLSDLDSLIDNWRYEKAIVDQQREEAKWVDKQRRRMQKMIDLQRRIGGYLDDGTTTEEELDREVELVFTGDKDLVRRRLEMIENDTDQMGEISEVAPDQPVESDEENEDNFDEV